MTKINQLIKISALYLGAALCIFALSRGLMVLGDPEAWYFSALGFTSEAAALILVAAIPLVLVAGVAWILISAAKYFRAESSAPSQASKDR